MTADFDFKLVPLDCPTCGAGIRAHGEDVVYYCTACRNGYRLEPSDWSLHLIETAFVSSPHLEVQEYRPFWLLPAWINLAQRKASGGSFTGLLRAFLGNDPDESQSGEGTFAVPAFRGSLDAITQLVRSYTQALPELQEKLGEQLLGGCYGQHDAEKLAHFALIATEVEKPDTLQELEYEIEFGEPRLLGVPFHTASGVTRDAFFKIEI